MKPATEKLKSPRHARYGSMPLELEAITHMLLMREKGKSGAQIAADLNARKVPAHRGSKWTKSSVIAITNRATSEINGTNKALENALRGQVLLWEREFRDWRTGKLKKRVERLDADDLREMRLEERIRADRIRRMAIMQALKERGLTLEQRLATLPEFNSNTKEIAYSFARDREFPGRASTAYAALSDVVKAMTNVTGRSIEKLINKMPGKTRAQKALKANIRRDVHRLLGEVARLREVVLAQDEQRQRASAQSKEKPPAKPAAELVKPHIRRSLTLTPSADRPAPPTRGTPLTNPVRPRGLTEEEREVRERAVRRATLWERDVPEEE